MSPVKLTSISALLEYYDFAIFALLANFISAQFFPHASKHIADLATFGIFALGYFVRPVGGIIFGIFGDRFGRKTAFLISILLMAFSTVFMGLLPTYAQIGVAAPLLFIFFRTIQGIAYGAELPGAITFLVEHVAGHRRSSKISFMVANVTLGSALSSFVIFISEKIFSAQQMQVWGWRLPFFLGGALAIVGYLIRKKLVETPYFLRETKRPRFALLDLLRHNWRQVLVGIGLILLPACCIIFFLSLPTFLSRGFQYPSKDIYLVMTIGNLCTTVALPFFGWMNDKFGRKKSLLFVTVCYVILNYPLFYVLTYQNFAALLSFAVVYQVLLAALAAGYFVMLAENFTTRVRFTGTAFCYNVAHLISSLVPMLSLFLYHVTQNPLSITAVFIAFALIMFASVWYSRDVMEKI